MTEEFPTEAHKPTVSVPPPHPPRTIHPDAPRRSGKGWLWMLVILLLCAGGYLYWSRNSNTQIVAAADKSGAADKKSGSGSIPVVATRVKKGDIGVYFPGLGAVTPLYTVTLKSRVDGEIINVRYEEGQLVNKGDQLIEIDPRPYQVLLDQYEGQLVRDQAILANAKVDLVRYQTLLKQNAIQEQQVATQQSLVAQTEGIVKSDQGLIDGAKLNLTYCKITAPIAGRVGLRLIDPGNIVHATDTTGLVVITQIQPISVIFTISEDQLPTVRQKMHEGQHLTVEAWDRDSTTKIAQGTLATIDNEIDQTTGTLRMRADFDNKNDALFPNQFINAKLLVQQKRGVVLVQTAGIQRSGTNTYVFLIKPDSTITLRDITVGTTEGDMTEITAGLQPGDEVVMTGVDKLLEGSPVKVQLQEDASPTSASGPGKSNGNKP